MVALQDLSILVIDDDDVAAEAVARCIGRELTGCTVVVAEDGRIALEVLRGLRPDKPICKPYVILLDLHMPRMNGVQFLKELRADAALRGSVVFVLSASDAPIDRLSAYHEFVAGFLDKSNLGNGLAGLARFLGEYRLACILPK
jgi:CheY-like chemotaxis protein